MSDMNTKVDLSVVMPVYNEEDNLGPLMEELEAVLKKTGAASKCFASTTAVRTTA